VARTKERGIWIAASFALAVLFGCQSPTTPRPMTRPGAVVVEIAPAQTRANRSVLYLERVSDPPPRVAGQQVVDIASEGSSFDPPLLVVRSGADIRFVNRGELAHLLFIADVNGRRERAVDPGGVSALLRFTRVGEHRFYCSLHPDENFAVFASPSDHFVVPDGSRTHRIDGLPAGRYQLSWWSDAGVRSVGVVEIRPGETAKHAIALGSVPR
jgi:plastocyanin